VFRPVFRLGTEHPKPAEIAGMTADPPTGLNPDKGDKIANITSHDRHTSPKITSPVPLPI
jgi:hypothetical protein